MRMNREMFRHDIDMQSAYFYDVTGLKIDTMKFFEVFIVGVVFSPLCTKCSTSLE